MKPFGWEPQPRPRPSISTVTLTVAATETPVEPYSVLPSGWAYDSDVIDQSGGTLYFATAAAGTVVEVVIRS